MGKSGEIYTNYILAMDPREHPDGLHLKCEGLDLSKNQEFQDRLDFGHFTSLGRHVEEVARVGSGEEISFRYHYRSLIDIQMDIFSKQLDI